MITPPYRLFFDTSVYIAALLSPTGAAGALLHLAEAGIIQMVVSEKVIIESDHVLTEKFPNLIQESRRMWKGLNPEMTPDPATHQAKPFLKKLPKADALILCAARSAKVSAFVTWNTQDFMKKDVAALVDFPIVIPADALGLFKKWINPFSQ